MANSKKYKRTAVSEESRSNVISNLPLGRSSQQTAVSTVGRLKPIFLDLPDKNSEETYVIADNIARYVPSISFAIENMIRMINSGYTIDCKTQKGKQFVEDFLEKLNPLGGGVNGLINNLARQSCVYATMCSEIVLDGNYMPLDITTIHPKTVKIAIEDGKYVCYQKRQDGHYYKLNEYSFDYTSTFNENDNPVGLSPILPAVRPAVMQGKMIDSLEKMMDKIPLFGQLFLKLDTTKVGRKAGETEEQYRNRLNEDIDTLVENFKNKQANDVFLTTEAVDADLKTGVAQNANYEDIFKFNDNLLADGAKIQNSFLNAGSGKNDTYGTVQFELMLRNVEYIQKLIVKVLKKHINLALLLAGINDEVDFQFNKNKSIDEFKSSQALLMYSQAYAIWLENGVIDEDAFARLVGLDRATGQRVAAAVERGNLNE